MEHWVQQKISLSAKPRGFHLITQEIIKQLPQVEEFSVGMAHLFIQHTSASLTINENADPDVRRDLEQHLNVLAPEGAPHYTHTAEGPDDMPAHIKTSLMGSDIWIPLHSGKLQLGTWQGIYLGEHRDAANARSIIATLFGQKKS